MTTALFNAWPQHMSYSYWFVFWFSSTYPADRIFCLISNCVSIEPPAGGGLILWVQLETRDRQPLSGGICGDIGGAELVVRGEGRGVAIFGGHHVRGGAQALADHLCGTVGVPPAGVGFGAARHPKHRYDIPYHEGRAARSVPPGPIKGGHIPNPREIGQWSTIK